MRKFVVHTGVAAPLMRINIDTDAIIPSREMKQVSKQGLGEGLFAGWRYSKPGSRDLKPEFILNKNEYKNTTIILSGINFGCGSSREHAVWALKEYGIRAIIAAGFGAIFYNNCIRNGLLPIILPDSEVEVLVEQVKSEPQQQCITIDLENQLVIAPDGVRFSFDIEPSHREMLLEGLDPIAVTFKQAEQISDFEQAYANRRPWLF